MSLRRPRSCACRFQHRKQPRLAGVPVLCCVPAQFLPTNVAAAAWEVLGAPMATGSVPPHCGADAAGLRDASHKADVSEGSLGDAQARWSPRLALLLPHEVQGAESGR